MSDDHFNDNFFKTLLGKMQQFTKETGERMEKAGAKKKAKPPNPNCRVCGSVLDMKPPYCARCVAALSQGDAAFVTLEVPPRFWLGPGAHEKFVGKVTIVDVATMDAFLRNPEEGAV